MWCWFYGICFLLCVIDIFSECAREIPLKEKKDITITDAFQKILDESNRKPNKIWVDKGSQFYNRSIKSWWGKKWGRNVFNASWRKSVVAERFLKTLKNKIYKYIPSISKIVYVDKLDDIMNKYNNTYHSTIKMKPVDVKWNTYINSSQDINDKDRNFKIGDIIAALKYKN